MKFKKLVAAFSAVTMLGSLAVAVPASAEETYEASITESHTASSAVNATDENIKVQTTKDEFADHTTDVRVTALDDDGNNNNGAKIGVFSLGKVTAGQKITVNVSLWITNNDLNAIGLYTTSEKVANNTGSDYTEVMNGTALAPLGTIGNPSKVNPFQVEKTSFTTNIKAGSAGNLPLGTPAGTASYTATITEENQGNLYFLAGGWNGKTRLIQIKDINVTYADTLGSIVNLASDNDTINDIITILNDATLSERLTINSAVTITKNSDSNPKISANKDILLKKDVTIDGVDVQTASQLKIDEGDVSLTVKNANVTGGILLGKNNGTLNLENTTVDKVVTRQGNPSDNKSDGNNSVKGTGTIDELFYRSEADTIDSDTLAIKKMTEKETSTSKQYFTFSGDSEKSYETVVVNVSGDDKTVGKATLGTAITGAGALLLEITDIPNNVTINSITLE